MADTDRTAALLESLRSYRPQFHPSGNGVCLSIIYGSDGDGRSLVKMFRREDETAAMEAAVHWLQSDRESAQ